MFNFISPYITAFKAGAIILLLSLVGYAYYTFKHTESQRDAAIAELEQYKLELALAVDASEKQIAYMDKAYDLFNEISKKKHEEQVTRLGLDNQKIRKDLENEKGNITQLLNDAYQLRNSQTSGDGRAMPEVSDATKLSSEAVSSATIALVRSGQSCALDYQDLMQAWLDGCKLYGCK